MGLKRTLVRLSAENPVTEAAFSGAVKIGQGRNMLELFRSVTGSYHFQVDERIREFELKDSEREGNVLIPLTQGAWWGAAYTFCILAHAFRTRGYEPTILLCHDDMTLCHKKDDPGEGVATCVRCDYLGNTFLDSFGLDPLYITDLLPPDYELGKVPDVDENHLVKYRGVTVSKYAAGSTRVFLKKRQIDFADDWERSIFETFLESAVKLVDVSYAAHEQMDFDAVVGTHPAYVYSGIYLDVAERLGIPSVSYGGGFREETVMFGNQSNRSPLPQFTDHAFLKDVLEEPLDEAENRRIKEFMRARISGEEVREYNYYLADATEDIEVQEDTTAVGLFTNLLWDDSLEDIDILFENPHSWVESTIERVTDANGVTLIIKPHPAEATRDSNERMDEWIREELAPLPQNVKLLPSDTKVDPYQLMDVIDCALVYNSTVGLEMAYSGKPAVTAADTHYRDLGITFDPDDEHEYASLLNCVGKLEVTEEMQKRAQRYAHFIFIRKHMEFPFLQTEAGNVNLLPVSADDLAPGNETFDTIVESIIADRPVVN